MSHFNLGEQEQQQQYNGQNLQPQQRKFIGPTHGLTSRHAGKGIASNLENIGGRILIQKEMMNHKQRMRHVKAVVNIELPWAHQQQQQHQRPMSSGGGGGPYRGGGGSRAGSRLSDATQSAEYMYGSGTRPHSRSSVGGGGRPQSAATANNSRATSAASVRPASGSLISTSKQHHQQQRFGKQQPMSHFDASSLTTDQQQTYKAMIRVLCTLQPEDSRSLVENMLSETEDKKLLLAYTGVFPDLDEPSASAQQEGGDE